MRRFSIRWREAIILGSLMLLAGCQSSSSVTPHRDYVLEKSRQAQGADQRIRFLVIHYTAEDFHTALNTLTDEHVSAHYLIPAQPPIVNGQPVAWQLVPESMRAWHAGESGWRGRTNINDTSIGIELENKGFTQRLLERQFYPYPALQVALVTSLSRDIVRRYQIKPQDVVAHSDIAPQRKEDPGPLFPWQQLAEKGVGAWPQAWRVKAFLHGRDPQQSVPMAGLLDKLARYGYPVTQDMTPRQQRRVVAAFQMHFRQRDYRGNPDAESEAIADALLQQYPSAAN
ncbi:N-acetylmuramoyl-L-alanine amidase [Rouxiella badensis]|uniref:N-acetylmuramoyl-L-alanine amidase n=1 Tax=Rouxiella badensis TaxID=1646377 RepID=UPI001D1525D9|nr:N-acetylmuramoyl-L-alanine amidase [Rouxiella badensis]MCC3701095.1 N-acetylmuramoyl-L-alanine amidase [Rouxiella badensis]